MIDLSFNLPMTEAAAFWRDKLHLSPGEFSALTDEAKPLAFGVSGIAKGEELTTVYNALQDALKKGITFDEWKTQAAAVFERRGWTGKRAWRLDTIFRTNIQTAYNVGRYQQMMQVKDARPWWRYSAVNDSRTRPAHRAMNGKIFPADHPFWDTWYPPNGFRCRCSVNSVSQANLDANGWTVETKDPTGTLYEPTDPDTGVRMPARLLMPDPGFMNNPAKNYFQHADQVMQDSLSRMEPRIAAQVRAEWYKFQQGPRDNPTIPIKTVGATSANFQKEITDTLAGIPQSIHDAVEKYGYTLTTGPKLTEIRPELKGLEPPGYPGRTWDNLEGVHNGPLKLISVAETYIPHGSSDFVPIPSVAGTVRHEFGHAVDRAYGNLSTTSGFLAARTKDRNAMTAVDRSEMEYLLQGGRSGSLETFAEVFCEIFGGGNESNAAKYFPNVVSYIKITLGI